LAKPKSKAQLLEVIRTRHKKLEEKITGLTEDEAVKPKTVGAWSVKDTIAHITTWEKQLLAWYSDGLTGKRIEIPDWRIKGTLGVINRGIFETNLSRNLNDVLADFTATYRQIIATIESIPEEDIFAEGKYSWTGDRTLFDYIWGNTAGHYSEHLRAIERKKH
jgi:hypothetical protein